MEDVKNLEQEIKWVDMWRSIKLLIIAVSYFYHTEAENTESALEEIPLSLDDKASHKLQSISVFILEAVIWNMLLNSFVLHKDVLHRGWRTLYFSRFPGAWDI